MDNIQMFTMLQSLSKKFSMTNSVFRVRNSLFYVPNYPDDVIQRIMVDNESYWDMQTLCVIDRYLPENAVICDIGANIGSHSIYWAVEKGASKIYAFEPLPEVCDILRENIKLNNMQDIIVPFNLAIFDVNSRATISSYTQANIGATSFKLLPNGNFKTKRLDDIFIEERVDLLKINVQGAEVEVLKGASQFIRKNKPIIALTSFYRRMECDELLLKLGYQRVETIRQNENFIYIPHQSIL